MGSAENGAYDLDEESRTLSFEEEELNEWLNFGIPDYLSRNE